MKSTYNKQLLNIRIQGLTRLKPCAAQKNLLSGEGAPWEHTGAELQVTTETEMS